METRRRNNGKEDEKIKRREKQRKKLGKVLWKEGKSKGR